MITYKLETRLRDQVTFAVTRQFHTYRAAVKYGQEYAGYGNFSIDTGNHIPSREEQLLIKTKTTNKKQQILNSI